MLNTPVAFIIFNRPDPTRRVFEQIRKARPTKLFVIADGPRNEKEKKLCNKTREITTEVDWDCEVLTNFSVENLGCKKRCTSGIDWVFSQTNQCIILEDDCVPDQSFFQYCEELLEKYKDEERIFSISGVNLTRKEFSNDSYLFSKYGNLWGWATWKRAWDNYDVSISDWPEFRKSSEFKRLPLNAKEKQMRIMDWDEIYYSGYDTWCYQWDYCKTRKRGLSIIPKKNLVSNIGFGEDAAHTKDTDSEFNNIPSACMTFPLVHPREIKENMAFDDTYFSRFIDMSWPQIIYLRIKKTIKKILN